MLISLRQELGLDQHELGIQAPQVVDLSLSLKHEDFTMNNGEFHVEFNCLAIKNFG